MLDAREREKLENFVRPILARRLDRGEALMAGRAKSTLPTLLRTLRGELGGSSDPMRSSVPSDVQCWIHTVDCALRVIGVIPSLVLYARLTRRPKSAERSWEQIQAEAHALALRFGLDDPTVPDLKQMFESALPILATIFEVRGITTSYRETLAA